MRRLLSLTACLVGMMGSLPVTAHASWVSNNCYEDGHAIEYARRTDARTYAEVADNEGYEWGGGCWNDNDADDTPSAPDSSGEGPDCSGFTFKTWRLKNAEGTSGWYWYSRWYPIHGPYSSYDFHSPASADPFFKLSSKSRSTMLYMDAFAKQGHVAMLYSTTNPSTYTDYVIEALGDAYGTDVNIQDYRYESEYVGVRREGWKADCYPRCDSAEPAAVIVP